MKIKTIKSIKVYNGAILNLRRDLVELESGNLAFREIVDHKDGVAIIPIVNDQIIFVKQYRIAVNKMMLELPAGLIEEGEDHKATGIRELREETGYEAKDVTYIGSYYVSPGFTNEKTHLYIAKDLVLNPLPQDEDENVVTEFIPINEAITMLKEGKFEDMKTALALSYYLNVANKIF